MKYLLIALLIFQLEAYEISLQRVKWDGKPIKQSITNNHIPYYFIGGVTSYYTYEFLPKSMPKWQKTAVALSVPVLLGLAKESTEKFNIKDVGDYAIGGFIGITLQFTF